MNVVLVITLVLAFAVLLFGGAPVALALGGSAMLTIFCFFGSTQYLSIPTGMAGATESHVLLAIPFFVLAGTILAKSTLSRRLVELAEIVTRRLPGGVGIAMVIAGIFLAGISGSGPADVAILGTIMLPMLLLQGYRRGVASGLTALSGSIGIIVPPSIALIIYGSVTPGVSIKRLFLGGVGPGMLMGGLLAVTIPWLAPRGTVAPPTPPSARGDLLPALWKAGWAMLFPFIILGGIYLGIFTPTESAAVAVVYALFVSAVIYRDLNLKVLVRCLADAARITAGVMILVACAALFARILTLEGVAAGVGTWLAETFRNRWLLLLGVNLLVLSAGCFLDAISIFYVLVPILLPALTRMGFDPVHLGVIFSVNLAIGQVTPPVGVNLFVSCGLSKAGIGETVRESWPLLVAAVIALILVNLVPQITLWLPNTMR